MRSITRFAIHGLAAASLAALAATGAAAADMFLKLGGVKGEDAKGSHSDQISVESFSWGATNSGSSAQGHKLQPGGGGGGGAAGGARVVAGDVDGDGRADVAAPGAPASGMPAGKRQHGWTTVSKPLDRGSVTVKGKLPGCTVDAAYPDAVLQTAAARYELKEVIISGCAMDSVSLNYARVKVRAWDPEKKEE